MPEQFGEKSHDATPHRREKAREDGHVARSQDLISATLLLAGALLLLGLGPGIARTLHELTAFHLAQAASAEASPDAVVAQVRTLLSELGGAVLPLLGLIMVAAAGVQVLQTGFLWVPQKLAMDWSRIDPLKGWQRLVSLTNLVRLGFGLVKLLIVGTVAVWSVTREWDQLLSFSELSIPQLAGTMLPLLLWTALRVGLALFVLAILEYGFQRWRYEQDLRMTTQEMREEMRTLQGDPMVIQRRRAIQRQLVLNRMHSAVPQADVVVTNPTELAIAIQYDIETMDAPVVVAKGAGLVAQKIRRMALENSVPVVERKELARYLYKHCEIGRAIPAEQYAAMAEVLRYVYQLKGKTLPQLK